MLPHMKEASSICCRELPSPTSSSWSCGSRSPWRRYGAGKIHNRWWLLWKSNEGLKLGLGQEGNLQQRKLGGGACWFTCCIFLCSWIFTETLLQKSYFSPYSLKFALSISSSFWWPSEFLSSYRFPPLLEQIELVDPVRIEEGQAVG